MLCCHTDTVPTWINVGGPLANWTYTLTPTWVDNTAYTIRARSIDTAGNQSLVESFGFTFDNDDPSVSSASSEIIDPVGGTVGSLETSSSELIVPSGAVTETVEFSIVTEDTTDSTEESLKQESESALNLTTSGSSLDITAIQVSDGASVTTFSEPIVITISYDPSLVSDPSTLGIYYWDESTNQWIELPSTQVDTTNHTVTATTDHLTTFRVFSRVAPKSLGPQNLILGEVFAFPNPAKGSAVYPTIHAELGLADKVEIRIYNLAGELVFATEMHEAPKIGINGKMAYEYTWNTGGYASGVYIYLVRGHKGGKTVKTLKKLAIIK